MAKRPGQGPAIRNGSVTIDELFRTGWENFARKQIYEDSSSPQNENALVAIKKRAVRPSLQAMRLSQYEGRENLICRQAFQLGQFRFA